jgi:hypothetical protein
MSSAFIDCANDGLDIKDATITPATTTIFMEIALYVPGESGRSILCGCQPAGKRFPRRHGESFA